MSDGDATGSVTHMIQELRKGESQAVANLWDRFFERLVRVARRRLGNRPRRYADEEDVALSVIETLVSGAAAGRFPKMEDRDDLWKMLLAITRQKAVDQIRHDLRQKRGGGDIRGESVFLKGDDPQRSWEAFLSEAPTPETIAILNEQFQRLMQTLPDDVLRTITKLKLESYTDEQIARHIGLSVATVERKRKRIREIWLSILEDSQDS